MPAEAQLIAAGWPIRDPGMPMWTIHLGYDESLSFSCGYKAHSYASYLGMLVGPESQVAGGVASATYGPLQR